MPRVESSIDWASSYRVTGWRVAIVDPSTWASSTQELVGVTGAKVYRDRSASLIESGSLEVDGEGINAESWARIEVLVRQAGILERHAVATLLLTPAPSRARRGLVTTTLDARSVLAPAEDEKMLAGSYVPRGADGAEWAARILRECTPAPVTVDGSFELDDYVVYARRTSRLEAARMLLEAGGWCLQIDGHGAIALRPRPEEPALTIDRSNAGLLGTEVESDDGCLGLPNRYTAWKSGQQGQATDEDMGRRTSHARTGRWVDVVDESPRLVAGETLQHYAERRLMEAVAVTGTREYGRSWVPGITTDDVIRGALPEAMLVGDMRVAKQELALGREFDLRETVEVIT